MITPAEPYLPKTNEEIAEILDKQVGKSVGERGRRLGGGRSHGQQAKVWGHTTFDTLHPLLWTTSGRAAPVFV